MPPDDPRSRFELAAAELRALGISLRRLPGEYCERGDRYGRGVTDQGDSSQAPEPPSPCGSSSTSTQKSKYRITEMRYLLRALCHAFAVGTDRTSGLFGVTQQKGRTGPGLAARLPRVRVSMS